ncbi:carbon monoxide dehydrogenase [Methylobacterium sp. Leaf361]|uniref:xanthine dehydrogenase family Fe-S subunit n=1 Tax=unclassified Methylobacterium TaxID=2615210 RepID=UPI0006FA7D7E|nr:MULTISPECIES: 2Fe-2S iron-sulfur cluster-binding protein [unclassified Methylobacterium]KQS79663.1 carbon monoxide dehydrogenase [Methylobacterium sp. Leaf361]SEH97425.1 carbon-monoxide dehydrogenase small subunit [Methylobacterium sp. 275MFSha3.1]SFT19577.1 carbon-monoxide dehydrogenase small subunit [Methylobacterium sp. yr668]
MSAALVEPGPSRMALALTVNGRAVRVAAEPRSHLGDVLRDGLDLTGTHLGCEHGVCGACTVLLDGEPARACLTYAGACAGAAVTTIEGLDADAIAGELRAAFNREHALQCGYCTPGMLVAARDLVLRLPEADERRIRVGLSGNLCRCTGYTGIVRAVMAVIAERRGRGIPPETSAARPLGPVGARIGDAAFAPLEPPADRIAPAAPAAVADLSDAFTPAHGFTQVLDLLHPPEAVFALLGDLAAVAACLPGAVLTARPTPDTVEGGLQVRIGPIAATFRGRARLARDEAARTGAVHGAGTDAGGRSATEGRIRYRVEAGPTPGTARVELDVGYTLTGPLAQFGRPGLVRDLAGRIAAEFTRNLDARLSGVAAPAPAGLNPLRLLLGLARARLAAWFGRA